MELQQYLRIVRDYWRSILASLFICIVVAAGVTLMQTPMYSTSSSVFITVESGGTAGELSQGANYAERQVNSFINVTTSEIVLQPAIDQLGLDTTPTRLAKALEVSSPANTSVIKIAAKDPSPEQASLLANTVAANLEEAVTSLAPPGPDGTRLVTATVINSAPIPASPVSPRVTTNLALGVLLGLLLGFGQAVLRNMLDTRIQTTEDIEQVTDAPVLAVIGHREGEAGRVAETSGPAWANAEAYRRLRTNVGFVGLGGQHRSSMVVTSSLTGEGKTETVVNLARVLAQAGSTVLLIDADLRRPQVAARMGIDADLGLTDVLTGRGPMYEFVVQVAPNLTVLSAGTVPPNPSELLGSDAMTHLLEAVEKHYDYVLFDSPPLLPVTDAVVLSAKVGGTIVIARSGEVRRPQLAAALDLLDAGEVTLFGLVLNDVPLSNRSHYYSSYYYSASQPTDEGAPDEVWKPRRKRQLSAR
ncbi:MAG: polysaccharide biosynthesis tyrosine autokinase [Propionibacterium sp.]|nr:polysaccharide biosynthesis tyrosine autokinase [Propionibacterium sp.]